MRGGTQIHRTPAARDLPPTQEKPHVQAANFSTDTRIVISVHDLGGGGGATSITATFKNGGAQDTPLKPPPEPRHGAITA